MAETQPDLWIFAYGSLMWRPDFAFAERRRAQVDGYHRALCIFSHHWRGTPERPGLVFGLDAGGTCTGIAYRIAPEARGPVLAAVRERELVTNVYRELDTSVRLDTGVMVAAVTYVADRAHPQYAGTLPYADMLGIVRGAVGVAGCNGDYVRNTQAHLVALGVDDPALARLCRDLERLQDGRANPPPFTTVSSPV